MSRRYLRPGVLVGHLLVLAASLTCLRLGWWQWDVAREARGTVQNLGYALLWPVFAGSFIYMWLRFLHLEAQRDVEEAADGATVSVTHSDADRDFDTDARRGGVTAKDAPGDRDGSAAARHPVVGVPEAGPGVGAAAGGRRGETDRSASPDGSGHRAAPKAETGGSVGAEGPDAPPAPERQPRRRTPTETFTVGIATVGGDDDDDPELAAYNQALAALAEQDRRRAR